MPKYQVEVNGRNFLLDMEDQLAKYGFITLRYVEAADSSTAETAAVALLRSSDKLRLGVRNDPEDPPVMDVTEIREVDSGEFHDNPQPGFLWYEENPRRWWQFWK
jgi:hypothetical protein